MNDRIAGLINLPIHMISSSISRVHHIGRCFFSAVAFLSVFLVAAPEAVAAVPNGNYKLSGGRGSLSSGGKTIVIPQSFMRELANQSGMIVVRNNRLLINRNGTAEVLRSILSGVGTRIRSVKVTGPTFVPLRGSGQRYTGKTNTPIRTQMKGIDDTGDAFTVNLITHISATINGRQVTLTTRFSGGDSEAQVVGNITLIGKL
jgi:hypothetical protein